MSTTTTTSLPSWLTDPTKDTLTKLQGWLGSDDNYTYGMKKGENLFTPFNPYQNKAMGNVGWLANQDLGKMFGLDAAKGGWDKYMGSGLVHGQVGSVKDYMSPYINRVLSPQIREIRQESDRQANDIGSQAASAGAFGDARHGIAEGENMEKTNQAISDATGQAYQNAFDRGQNQQNIVTERQATGAQGLQGVGDNLFQKYNDVNDSLYNAGSLAYNMDEKQRQTQQAFQEALKNKDYDDAIKMLAALNGSPRNSTTETSSNDGLFGILGSLLGGLF
jgi:hypothetical protein